MDKDSEMHTLVRWQFVGGLRSLSAKRFYSEISKMREEGHELPIVVGALAANQDIYSIGMGVPVEEIGRKWEQAIANPIPHPKFRRRLVTRSSLKAKI